MILSILAALLLTPMAPNAAAQPASDASTPQEYAPPVTILISIDGGRADYLDRGVTPALSALAEKGVTGPMHPSFPSKTFPNHWTLVTGLRPDEHGITANNMEDPRRPGERFSTATSDPFWWNEAMPVWVAAEQAGIRSAIMFWPGSNVAWGAAPDPADPDHMLEGTRPSDWQQFNQAVTNRQRVNAVLDWMRRPADIRPQFVALYFDTIDTAGHHFGPDDPRTTEALHALDAEIGRLVTELHTMGREANIVVVADHGMAAVSSDRVIALDTLLPAEDARIIEHGPYATLQPAPGHEQDVAAALGRPHEHMRCWPKERIPERFHYGHHRRIPAWLCLAKSGWSILPTAGRAEGGAHGYDPEDPEMAALFIASGPAIKAGTTVDAFDNIAVEPLLRRLIGLPQRREAKPGALTEVLKEADER
ncbi:ectonucleotide pyrophosphatase/phosphodiesterase [Altericroceibacterium endophyticum]|nr:ectonucleotide pyrophosphatase/phosphodiesterase [Altericroceibacterium endophyticum]